MTGFQRLCLTTAGVVFLLIVVGGIVRATHSGLGCPDWPTCHGRLIPTTDKHTIIEYSHRLTATVAGFLGLSVLIWAALRYRHVPAIFNVTCAGFVLGVLQAGLGGAVVENELPPGLVVVHLALALTIVTLLVLLAITSFAYEGALMPVRLAERDFGRLTVLALVTTLTMMLVGAYVSGAHYGLACNSWPLCNGQVIPANQPSPVQLIFAHRVLALLLGIELVALLRLGWQARRESPIAMRFAALASAIYIVQAIIGAANVWTRLADEVSAAHLAVGTLLWITLAVLCIRVYRLYNLFPWSASEGVHSNLAGAQR